MPALGQGLRGGAVFTNRSLDQLKTLRMGLEAREIQLDNLADFFLWGVRAGGNVFDLQNDLTDRRFQQRQIQRFFVGVVVVQQARVHTRLIRNLADGRAAKPALGEQGLGNRTDSSSVVRRGRGFDGACHNDVFTDRERSTTNQMINCLCN